MYFFLIFPYVPSEGEFEHRVTCIPPCQIMRHENLNYPKSLHERSAIYIIHTT